MKNIKGLLSGLTVIAALTLGIVPANAAVFTPGPQDPVNGFPQWYTEPAPPAAAGLSLAPCLSQTISPDPLALGEPMCILLTGPGDPFVPTNPIVFPTNFPQESFYFIANARILNIGGGQRVDYRAALEAAFSNGAVVAGQQITFARIDWRFTAPVTGTYRVTHPFGQRTFTGITAGQQINVQDDVGIGTPGGPFVAIETTPPADNLARYLVKSASAGGAPTPITVGNELFLGDPNVDQFVTGATQPTPGNPTVPFNALMVEVDTGAGFSQIGFTDQFQLAGKVIGLQASTPTLGFGPALVNAGTQSLTVTITNLSGINLTAVTPAITGTNGTDFTINPTGTTCGGALAINGTCDINVLFNPLPLTPEAALRAGTLTVNATVAAGTAPPPATVTLSGTAQYQLTVTVTNSPIGTPGSGSVSSTPAGIANCTATGGTCIASFDAGATITLTPTAASTPLSLFNGWNGDNTTTGNFSVPMNNTAVKTVTADFIKAWNFTTTPTNATATALGTIGGSTGITNSVVKHGFIPTVTVDRVSACNRITAFTDTANPSATLTAATALTSTYTLSPAITAERALGVTFDNRQAVNVSPAANITGGGISGGTATITCGQTMPTFTVTPNTKQFQVRAITKDGAAQTFTPATSVGGAVSFPFPAITTSSDTPLVLTATFMPSGDLDGDGALGLADALKSLRIFLGTLSSPTADDLTAMDVFPLDGTTGQPTGDNTRDIKDVLTILKRVIGAVSW